MLAIVHATIIGPDAAIEDGVALVDGGRIQAVGGAELPVPPSAEVRDATGLVLAPGLLDLQVNGGFGLDFTADPHAIWEVAARLPRYGVTGFLPTIITAPLETARLAQQVLAETQDAILPLVPYLDTIRWVFIAAALAGIAVAIYARIDDCQAGRR